MRQDGLLRQYEEITEQLEGWLVERSECQAAELVTRANAYADLCARGDKNITTIREEADFAAHKHRADAIKLSGDIDAANARLRLLDRLLAT